MTENTSASQPVSASSGTVAQANAVATDQTTQAGAATSHSDKVNMNQTVNGLADLKTKAPKVYEHMMLGIATNICNTMKRQQERLKQAIRSGQRGY